MNKKLTHRQDQQFEKILGQIQTAKQQALQQVNKTLVQLYWDIGNYVAKQVTVANWGKSTVEQLAAFIQKKEPNIGGFTASNIWRMRQFYETYKENEKLATLWREIPWSHNRRIMTIKTLEEREFYLEALDQSEKLLHENPSIGVLLCREKDDEVVKLALNRSLRPTVIADYETRLIPKELLRKKMNEFYALLEGGE